MTSLFDPLYEVSTPAPPSLDEINSTLSEFDGSGSGLMTARQLLAACKDIANLGFTAEELTNYVKEGQEVAGDGSGKIKMSEFATYLAFEAKKKYNKTQKTSPKTASPDDSENGMVYTNPFGADTNNKMKITLTPDPKMSPSQTGQSVDMRGAYSPTQADPTDLPDWFGHSLNTIQNHPNEPSAISPFDLFDDDDGKQPDAAYSNNNNDRPNLMNVATNDILFRQDSDTTSSPNLIGSPSGGSSHGSSISLMPNLSPTKAKSMAKNKGSHGVAKSMNVGMIAPPRAKGDKRASTKKKRKGKHGAAVSASFSNVFGVSSEDLGLKDRTPKLKDSQSAAVPDTTYSKRPTASKLKKMSSEGNIAKKIVVKKKKRPKIDAIVEMKRGAAMLKYGRRGFPHFRRFQVSHDLTKLLWYSRKKSLQDTHVAVKEMKDILNGQQTEVFKQCTQKTLQKASFSIIYGTKLKSLDVVAKSAEEAELWIKGLKGLIKANQQGKLHKVVQILVDVDFKDISKTKYRNVEDEAERRKYEVQHKNRPELVTTISTTLMQSQKIFVSLVKISKSGNVVGSNEYDNVQTLTSEVEQRMEEIQFGLDNKTADLTDLKRDVWVLKVDVTVLEEKVKVLSKIKTAIPI